MGNFFFFTQASGAESKESMTTTSEALAQWGHRGQDTHQLVDGVS